MSAAVETTSPATETAAPAPPSAVADLDALLAPIAGENPAGESLQYSGLHDELREARRVEDNLAQGEWQYETKVADYHQVISLATPALATQTKDLQVCAWLCEALVKLHGFPGLRDGLKLMRGLHEQFWEKVYPEIDEGDMEARANSVAWMDRELGLAIKEVPLTQAQGGGVNYSYLGYEQSKQFDIPENLEKLDAGKLAQMEELRAQALEEGKTTGEDWRKAFHNTRRAFYEETWRVLDECWAEYQALDKVMDEKYDRQTPGLGSLKKSLDEVRTLVEKLLKEKRILEPDPVADAEGAEGEAGAGDGAQGISTGPVRTRQEALRRLAEVSDYFRRTEPHSPVAYLVQRAIKWGQMPLETWLQDVIKDDTVLGQLRETLGLNTSDGGEQS
jgi:type VI secretion system protein ImpA